MAHGYNPLSHKFKTMKTLNYPWETEKLMGNTFATWFCCLFIFFLYASKSSQTAAMGVLGTPGYTMPYAGWGHELPYAGHGWLRHRWEQHCSLSGIPGALTLMHLRKRRSHCGEGTHEDTGEEEWRGHERAISGDMAGDALCEGCAPCQSRDYSGTMSVDDPRWGRNIPEGLRPSLKVLGGIKYKTQQK